jgi:hypothetical protein
VQLGRQSRHTARFNIASFSFRPLHLLAEACLLNVLFQPSRQSTPSETYINISIVTMAAASSWWCRVWCSVGHYAPGGITYVSAYGKVVGLIQPEYLTRLANLTRQSMRLWVSDRVNRSLEPLISWSQHQQATVPCQGRDTGVVPPIAREDACGRFDQALGMQAGASLASRCGRVSGEETAPARIQSAETRAVWAQGARVENRWRA